MSVKQRDPLTGHATTGHEWNGITELNTRVPKIIWWAIGLTHLWAVVIWLLLPAWPMVNSHTTGLLGADQRTDVEQSVVAAKLANETWRAEIEQTSVDEIMAQPALMTRVYQTAPALFGDNCAACHGTSAAGGPGFPSLIDDAWLWGNSADAIEETLRVGINSAHAETRYSEMLAFGRDQMLSAEEIRNVVHYVQSLSIPNGPPDEASAGAELFFNNCAGCHGETGTGNTDLGAPDLTDDFWIYGGDADALFETIWNGRRGQMPTWEDRLSATDRKMLTAYVLSLGTGAD